MHDDLAKLKLLAMPAMAAAAAVSAAARGPAVRGGVGAAGVLPPRLRVLVQAVVLAAHLRSPEETGFSIRLHEAMLC